MNARLSDQRGQVAAPALMAVLVRLVPVRDREGVVVPQHREQAVLACELHHTLRVGPLGHEVAGQHHAIASGITAPPEQQAQFVGTAMNVANDDSPLHRRPAS